MRYYQALRTKMRPLAFGVIFLIALLFVTEFNLPVLRPILSKLNHFIYDNLVYFHYFKSGHQVRVVIIDVDKKSVNRIGKWPWSRDKIAILVEQLKKYGVVLEAFDVVMSEPDVNYAIGLNRQLKEQNLPEYLLKLPEILEKTVDWVDSDKKLAKAIADNNVALGFFFDNEENTIVGQLPEPLKNDASQPIVIKNSEIMQFASYQANIKILADASATGGFVTNIPDRDGMVRHGLLLARYQNIVYPNLVLATAMNYLLSDKTTLIWQTSGNTRQLQGIKIDEVFIPTTPEGKILIPFYGPPGSLDYYSASDVIDGKLPPDELQGTIAVIGSSMVLLSDLHATPMSKNFPGVELMASMVKGLLEQKIPHYTSGKYLNKRVNLIVLGLFLAALLPNLSVGLMFAATLVLLVLILSLSLCLFVFYNSYLEVGEYLILVVALSSINYVYSYIVERQQRKKVSNLFSQYVPESYVEELISRSEQWSLEGQLRTMTVFFADIRNFTSLSEELGPRQVKSLLNEVFTPITQIIHKHHGTIDKYVGDMVVAFWGAPLDDKDHIANAVRSALKIQDFLPDLNQSLSEMGLPPINLGMGLAAGPMYVGDMGSKFRRAYTVLGDRVNLASRLENLTKYYQVGILVSETVPLANDPFVWRPIDKVKVKGKTKAITIYQPLGLEGSVSAEQLSELQAYRMALKEYYGQNWQDANLLFLSLIENYPNVYLYQIYLQRIAQLMAQPPAKDWDGSFVHLQKKYKQ